MLGAAQRRLRQPQHRLGATQRRARLESRPFRAGRMSRSPCRRPPLLGGVGGGHVEPTRSYRSCASGKDGRSPGTLKSISLKWLDGAGERLFACSVVND